MTAKVNSVYGVCTNLRPLKPISELPKLGERLYEPIIRGLG